MLTFQQELKAIILGIVIWLTVAPIFIVPYLIFSAVSLLVHLLAKLFQPELIPISKCDSFFAFAPSNTEYSYVYCCQVWKVKGLVDPNKFRAHFQTCFLSTEKDRKKYQNLYCHFVQYLGYIFKQKVEQIDLNWHIGQLHLQEGESLEQFLGSWMVTHDKGPSQNVKVPSWMIIIIHNEAENQTHVLFKLHHGLCDGYTVVHLLDKLSGQKSPYLFKEPLPTKRQIFKTFIQFPYLTWSLWQQMYLARKKTNGLTGQSGNVENINEKIWLISLASLNLETVKSIRRATKTSFVTVLMSVQIGALQRLLKEIRPGAKIHDLEETFIWYSQGWPNHPVPLNEGGMINHLVMNIIEANYGISDPLERLLNIHENFQTTLDNNFPIAVYYLMLGVIKNYPSWIVRLFCKQDFSIVSAETGLSSLLGSSKPHFLLGHQVEHIWLPVIAASCARNKKLMTVPFSHSGLLDISVNAESSLVKNQETLDRLVKVHFVEELESLRKRCQQILSSVCGSVTS